jgi:hypothetical protein
LPLVGAADEEVHVCHEWARTLMQALGSDAPACTIVPPASRHLVQHLIAHGTWGPSALEATQASTCVPLLLEPTKRILGLGVPAEDCAGDGALLADHFKVLLRKLVEVRGMHMLWD